MLVGAFQIDPGVGYDRIGPRFFPFVVATGLVVLGSWYAVSAWWNSKRLLQHLPQRDEASHLNWMASGLLALSFVLAVTMLERVGFVIASSIQFWFVTRAFGSRRSVGDALVAVVVATVVYLAFSRGLGLALP
jgi:putative tricarboxylic transport membrane protein